MLWEILKASKGILVADFYADLWANIAGGGTPVDVFVEMIGSLPLYYNGKGYDLTDYRISGNAVQDGTPSPEAPVDVVGCGIWDETQQSYKLPPTVNGTEYPIYLGTVPTTRRIKKLVLTGEERWGFYSDNNSPYGTWQFYVAGAIDGLALSSAFSNIAGYGATATTRARYLYGAYLVTSGTGVAFQMAGAKDVFTDIASWKSYLAAQYAAGTPVTVWYILAEPETAVVNEPLMKIGDYADTISFAQSQVAIPTVNGANVLDMASPVKPSEVYIKGKGIKPTGYGQLVDKNSVCILDKNDVCILVHGQ